MLKSISQKYALRARKFSDMVALLGNYNEVTPEFLDLFKEIQRQRALCRETEEKLERYLQQESDKPKAAGAGEIF